MKIMSEDILEKIESGNYALIPTWERYLRFITLIAVISLIFYTGAWTKNQEVTMSTHIENMDEHRTLREAQKEFVTRREYDILYSLLSKMNTNLEQITRKLN